VYSGTLGPHGNSDNKNNTKTKLGTIGAAGGLESGRNCRICLDEADTEENPFITPCKCDGSMKFIHLSCLQEWLDSKRVSQKLDGVYSYYWEELVCELCKEPLALNNITVNS
jgi:E3 ubiquitin-protein ligase DOA10